ncbi:MAG: Lrp/AsnC family transcriptional regulator, partial [Nanoarchaeota archaeon]|nr:Lrp/AsnC family transcriptional regulator [Nanoarchaeota archaeon]
FDVLTHYYEDTLGYKSFCHDYKLLQYYKPMEPVLVELSKDQELILNILMNHTNISYLELSRKTKFNYLKLKRIIKYLVFNGLIRFSIDPDYRKLGLEFHNMFIKIKISEKNIFEDYIKSNPRVHWIKFCQGKWDYIISITAKDINEFIDITKNIRTENKKIIIEETSLISKVKTPRKI